MQPEECHVAADCAPGPDHRTPGSRLSGSVLLGQGRPARRV